MEIKKVTVMGLGYIGLPTAATIASRGIDVVGVDINKSVVDTISKGEVHFSEADLDMMVHSAVSTGRLRAVSEPEEADVFIIAVPTPIDSNHKPDLSYVKKASKAIAKVLKPGDLVILESTSPVGTTEKLAHWIHEERQDLRLPTESDQAIDIHLCYCPERILPGRMLFELVVNDRIIGGMTPDCSQRAERLYKTFVRGRCYKTEARVAELVKLVENAYRDVNIAFANELSMICDLLDVDVWKAVELANKHPRVNILSPGPGVGGHCIAIDPWFLVDSAPERSGLIRAARQTNIEKTEFVLNMARDRINRFTRPKVACLGLTYKADVDDLRESPAVYIVRQLAIDNAAYLLIVEPHIESLPTDLQEYTHVSLDSLANVIRQADIILLLVDHDDFKNIHADSLIKKVVIDSKGVWA